MSYCVYILRCEDGSLYTGVTTELARRFAEHRSGKGAKYTASHRPVRCECAWLAQDRASAQRLEARIKRLSRAVKEELLSGAEPETLCLSQYTRLAVTDTGEILDT